LVSTSRTDTGSHTGHAHEKTRYHLQSGSPWPGSAGRVPLWSLLAAAQTPEVKYIADTLAVQAEGTYEADPGPCHHDIQIFSQQKDLKRAYDAATESMQRIIDRSEKNNLRKDDVATGVLTVAPIYDVPTDYRD
jgi:uncharacterized protein YggE